MWGLRDRFKRLEAAIRHADQARDEGQYERAAKAYADVLHLQPERYDIRIQMANMLKDCGKFDLAEREYLRALDQDAGAADTYVQLGHLYKVTGRRASAEASYRKALELDPLSAPARRELAEGGDATSQLAVFEAQMRAGGTEALLSVVAQLKAISEQVTQLRAALPEAAARAAFPIDAYAELRRLFDVPPPGELNDDLEIAIIVLADREPLSELHGLISAFSNQSHQKWRAIAVGADPSRRAIVERAAARDERFTWREAGQPRSEAVTEMEVASALETDWVLLLAPGAKPHPHALAWIATTAAATGCQAMVFDDEIGAPGEKDDRLRAVLRQTVDYETLCAANVYGETIALTSQALIEVRSPPVRETISFARSRLLLTLAKAGPIAHVPLPLFRARLEAQRSVEDLTNDHRRAVRAHFRRQTDVQIEASPWSPAITWVRRPPRDPGASIAVIIPSRDNLPDLTHFLNSLVERTARPDRLELLVVNNGAATAENTIMRCLKRPANIRVLNLPEPFNWSRFNNIGAAETTSPYLLFANDDMSMITPDWDVIVRSQLERSEVGAVGARLLYPDGTIQHAGILFDWRGSMIHDGVHRTAETAGPTLRWHTPRFASAVTGAFLATRRSDFDAVGGFDATHLAVAYSDIDYALKLRARGAKILWTPAITLLHFESKTRGLDHLDPAKAARDTAERSIMRARWGGVLDFDPSLNPFWRAAALPHQLVGFPSHVRILAHTLESARANPWRIERPDSAQPA